MRLIFFIGFTVCLVASAFAESAPNQNASQASSGPAAIAPDGATAMKEIKVGDRWTYDQTDQISGELKGTLTYIVTDVSNNQIGVRVQTLGSSGAGFLTYDPSWNLISNGQTKYHPNDGTGVRLPLLAGKQWDYRYNQLLAARGASFLGIGHSKVVALEKITTQAGAFDAYKIEKTASARYIQDPTKRYDIKTTDWYAPAVDHWVKRLFELRFEGHLRESYSLELVEYDPGQ